MKTPEDQTLYTGKQSKNTTLFLIGLLGVFLIFTMLDILNALLSAIILYTLFKPFYVYLIKRKNFNRSFSAIIVMVISFLIIVLPLMGLGWMILNKLMDFQKNPETITNIINKVTDFVGPGFDKKELIKNGLSDISKWVLTLLSFFVNGAVRVFITLLVLYFTLFFMFRSYDSMETTLIGYLPFSKTQSMKFGKELKDITYSNVLGQGMIGVCQGIIVAVGFLIFKIPEPFFWGIVSVFVCFLPIVGAPLIFVPAGIIELSMGNTTSGVGILIWGGVLVTLLDNFLRQFISKKIADTHPLITIIGVIIGVPFFGLIGLVIGPLLISYFILLVKTYESIHIISAPSDEIKNDRANN